MPSYEENWLAAMRALPAFPRVLFRIHSFYDVDPAMMAEGLTTDVDSIVLSLAEARSMIHAYRPYHLPDRFLADGIGLPVALLEQRVRQQYRDWLEATLAASGYTGAISWPELPAAMEADEEAVAAFILSTLPGELQKAVERSRKAGVATIDLWRHVLPWRRILRRRLGRVRREISYSGWRPFEEWAADQIMPDRFYPHGYMTVPIRRRSLPDENGFQPKPEANDAPLTDGQTRMQERFDRLPALTQDAYLLFIRYGRTHEEIAKRLGIGRRHAKRRIDSAIYIMCGWPLPSFASHLFFEMNWRWARLQRQAHRIRTALRG